MTRWHIDDRPTSLQLHEIARFLIEGKVVLLPTDTIYGLHAVATSEEAVSRLVEMKGRDEAKPFIALASSVEQLSQLGVSAGDRVMNILREIWPAPLTVILPLEQPVPASRGMNTLAVRVPALDWLRDLLERTGPLVSTSANRSGEPAVEHPSLLAHHLQNSIDAVVDGGTRRGEASAILDLTSDEPQFIRKGEFSFTQNLWKTLRKTP